MPKSKLRRYTLPDAVVAHTLQSGHRNRISSSSSSSHTHLIEKDGGSFDMDSRRRASVETLLQQVEILRAPHRLDPLTMGSSYISDTVLLSTEKLHASIDRVIA